MLTLLLTALAVGAPETPPPVKAPPAEIVVKGKSELVCTSVRITGSRIARGRQCRTREQADLDAQLARDGAAHLAGIERVREALHCSSGGGPGGGTTQAPSPKMCN